MAGFEVLHFYSDTAELDDEAERLRHRVELLEALAGWATTPSVVTRLQLAIRRYLVNTRIKKRRADNAALTLQRIARGAVVRNEIRIIQELAESWHECQLAHAARCIQRAYVTYHKRWHMAPKAKNVLRIMELERQCQIQQEIIRRQRSVRKERHQARTAKHKGN